MLVITWKNVRITEKMVDIIDMEHRIKLDSLIEAEHSITLPTYPIRKETFRMCNSYISPIKLIDIAMQWWHEYYPEEKFTQERKNIDKVLRPTDAHEETIAIDLNKLKNYKIEKNEIQRIRFRVLVKFRLNKIYITKIITNYF